MSSDLEVQFERLIAREPAGDVDTVLRGVDRRLARAARTRRVTLAVGVAAALVATVLVVARVGDRKDRVIVDVPPGPTSTTTSVPEVVAGTWRTLAPSPLSERGGPQYVWTGSRLLIWGGFHYDQASNGMVALADGAAYDPATDRWTMLAPAPIAARTGAASVWTGSTWLLWGGAGGGVDRFGDRADGAAYDPAHDRWSLLPPSPLGAKNVDRQYDEYGAWTGKALIVWREREGVGASYDPATRRWTTLPGAPVSVRDSALVAWDGSRLVVAGGFAVSADGAEDLAHPLTDGAAFDPSTGEWQRMPSLAMTAGPSVLTDAGLVVLGTWGIVDRSPIVPFLFAGERWQRLDPVPGEALPLPSPVGPAALLWTGREVLAVNVFRSGVGIAALDPTTGRWRVVGAEQAPAGLGNGAYAWTGTEVLAWGGQGGGAGSTSNSGGAFRPTGR